MVVGEVDAEYERDFIKEKLGSWREEKEGERV